MRKSDAIYAFYELNERFATAIRFFVGDSLDLRNVSPAVTIYVLNQFGSKIHHLALGDQSFDISTGQDYLTKYWVNLETLNIFCTTTHHDIRDYLAFIHRKLESFAVAFRYGKYYCSTDRISYYLPPQIQPKFTYHELVLHIASDEDANLSRLQWHEQSVEMIDGLYQIENLFGHKFLIYRKQDSRIYLGDDEPLEQRIFRLEHVRYREYRLRHHQSNKILNIYQHSLNNEAPLVTDSQTDQTFTFQYVNDSNKDYYIWPAHQPPTHRRKVLDIHNDPYGHARQNGAQVQSYDFHGGLNQRFRLHAINQNITQLANKVFQVNLCDT
ncbi:unnamed protein product [Rotaria sordida]|uniref:Ricin B lectin domain-containing protein n=2 Tax=Rotaria sordida TaxID=392033 RepID=A0A816D251_9BILA|nr:unnamed protein product [Rotaria sordida]